MNKQLTIVLFAIVVVAQLFIPAREVWQSEDLIDRAQTFKFRLQPVDPIDPLRGRYVRLDFADRTYKFDEPVDWESGIDIFVVLKEDSEGFAIPDTVLLERPDQQPFVIAQMSRRILSKKKITIKYPFERFYMDEDKAQEAEKILGDLNDSIQVYATVAISSDGEGLLKDVLVDGTPIQEVLE